LAWLFPDVASGASPRAGPGHLGLEKNTNKKKILGKRGRGGKKKKKTIFSKAAIGSS